MYRGVWKDGTQVDISLTVVVAVRRAVSYKIGGQSLTATKVLVGVDIPLKKTVYTTITHIYGATVTIFNDVGVTYMGFIWPYVKGIVFFFSIRVVGFVFATTVDKGSILEDAILIGLISETTLAETIGLISS